MKIIKEEYGVSRNDVGLSTIIEGDGGLKIMLDIRSNEYMMQCHANLSVFNQSDLKWNTVDSIHFSNMKTMKGVGNIPAEKTARNLEQYFADDRATLISMAEAILGDKFSDPEPKSTAVKKSKP